MGPSRTLVRLLALAGVALAMQSCRDNAATMAERSSEALNTAPRIGDFVIYAERSIDIGVHGIVNGGDIGVEFTAATSFGAQLLVGDFVQTDPGHNLLSPSVTLGSKCQVGDVQAKQIQNNGATAIGQVAPFPASQMPPAPLGTPPLGAAQAVTVEAHQTSSLAPGAYGDLTIADHATVTFASGAYSFTSFSVGEHSQLTGDAAGVTVAVDGPFTLAGWSSITSSAAAGHFFITVSAMDSGGAAAPAASVATHDQLTALLAVPNGTLVVADHVQIVGAVAAFDASISDHVQLTFQSGFPASAQGSQPLMGYINQPAVSAPVVGPVPPSTPIPLGIALPLQNLAQLQAFAQQVSDPTSAVYRHYIGPSDFGAQYGATGHDYQTLVTWAQAITPTTTSYPNNLYVDMAPTAAQVEQALHVNLLYGTRPDGSRFYEPDREPSITLSVQILGIDGMDNYDLPYGLNANGSGTGGSYVSSDLRNAYVPTCESLTGQGQTIAVIDPIDPFNLQDAITYRSTVGLPANPAPTIQSVQGGLNNAAANITTSNVEPCLDLEAAMAMAPGASVISFQGPSFGPILNAIANASQTLSLTISQLSSSYGQGAVQCNPRQTMQQTIMQFITQGQSFYQSSGDLGAYDPNANGLCFLSEEGPPVDYRSLLNIMVVGGTNLSMTGSGATYAGEVVWDNGPCNGNNCVGSGGGILTAAPPWTCSGPNPFANGFPLPSYQQQLPAANGVSAANRNLPDIAMMARDMVVVDTLASPPNTPPALQITPVPGQVVAGIQGTSVAAPLWAGFTALMNQQITSTPGQQPVGFAAPTFYAIAEFQSLYGSDFNDITSATNTPGCFSPGYQAGTGYDLTTGLGTPTCNLISQMTTITAPPAVTITLTSIDYGTTGGNVFNCGSSAGFNYHPENDETYVCNPVVANGALSATPVTTTTQIGCGDNHGALVTITCAGSGSPGDPSINVSVGLSLSSSCDATLNGTQVSASNIDGHNLDTSTFTGLLPQSSQNGSPEACDVFSTACATGQFCSFNIFGAQVTVTNTGGF